MIYERKSILLEQLSNLLYETEWKHGISYNTGKNASFIVYIYLPNGTQLSWHCNEYQMMYYYPEIQCEWEDMHDNGEDSKLHLHKIQDWHDVLE